jgi:1-acyl-sn-glycerol-3-phosphate acyltransferase
MRGWLPWLLYEAGYWFFLVGMMLGNSYRFEGRRNIPRTGAALLIANHQSYLDPPAAGCATRRHVSFLARKTLFRNRFFGGLIRRCNAVPVDQEGIAKEGLKAILEHLKAGEAVLVFPEGERTFTGEIQPLRPGILMLLKRIDVPIVPIGIAGAFDAWPRTRKWPRFSPLFLPPTGADIAVSVGEPIPAAHFRQLSRSEVLTELFAVLQRVHARAERLRRKTY